MSKTKKTSKLRFNRVFRGSNWYYDQQNAWVAFFGYCRLAEGRYGLGFRLIEVLDEQD
jgi:hypothetical protein